VIILGINDSHNATAAILKDGKIIACVSEERFTRIKNQGGIPIKSINYCLEQSNVKGSELDGIFISGQYPTPLVFSTSTKDIKNPTRVSIMGNIYSRARHYQYFVLKQWLEYHFPVAEKINDQIYNLSIKIITPRVKAQKKEAYSKLLSISKDKVFFVDHHICHAYAAIFSSNFPLQRKDALVFTADAQGDKLSASLSVYKNNQFNREVEIPIRDSLGAFFTEITIYLGMKPNEHEYKVMGLAPYAPENEVAKVYKILSQLIWLDKKSLQFKSLIHSELFSKYLKERLPGYRFDYIAGAAQKLTENLLTSWIEENVKKYKINNVACGGGVFMNVKANQKITESPQVRQAFFMPSSGDESNAIGAAFWGFITLTNLVPHPLTHLYLGPEFTAKEINSSIKKIQHKNKYEVKFHRNIEEKIADLLSKGHIVARFAGKMEWGARSLGNRSILSSPNKSENIQTINKMIKSRDFWMPFAPVILDKWQNRYLKKSEKVDAPYMTITFNSTSLAQKDLIATIHPYDKTLRPQILVENWNPSLYKIITIFSKKTGIGSILNTSFNLHGEPIVLSPADAIRTFEMSNLNYLAMENFLISKNHLN